MNLMENSSDEAEVGKTFLFEDMSNYKADQAKEIDVKQIGQDYSEKEAPEDPENCEREGCAVGKEFADTEAQLDEEVSKEEAVLGGHADELSLHPADLAPGVLAVVHCPLLPAQPSKVDEPLLQAMELVEFVPGLGGQADVLYPPFNV